VASDDEDREIGARTTSSPLIAEAPGGSEAPSAAWSLLLRDRVRRRVHGSDRYRWWVLWSVLSGMFAAGFSFTILAVSIPDIAADLGTNETSLTWVVSAPLLMFAVAMPILGKAGDVYGHRRVYLTGLSTFVCFTALSAAAWNAPALIAIRTIAALEGAATGPASMAIINRSFSAEDRVKAMGWFSLVGAGAPVLGLIVGGVVIDAFGWRMLFLMQLPLAAFALVVNTVVLRETPRRERTPLDVRGALAVATAAVATLLVLERGRALGFTHPVVIAVSVAIPLGVIGFVFAERRAVEPLIPLEFFRRRNFSAPLVAQFFGNVAYMGGFIISPLLMQHVFGYTVAGAALAMMWRPLSFSLCAPMAGYAATRVGERIAAVAGESAVAGSLVLMALGASQRSVVLVVLGLVVSGIGMGVASPSLQSSVANAVDEQHLGIAGASQQMVFTVGASAGIQLLSVVLGGSRLADDFTTAYLVGAAMGVCAIVGALFVRSLPRQRAALEVVRAA